MNGQLQQNNKRKIMIVGLPRSGTTLLANLIHSISYSVCFIEPHWEFKRYGETLCFNDSKVKNIPQLCYNYHDLLPINDALNRMLKEFKVVGFKETFRSEVYKNIAPDLVNIELLNKYKNAQYELICIIRNPIDVWNSMKSFNPEMKGWSSKIDLFIENYCLFFDFIKPSNSILYENLVESTGNILRALGFKNVENITLFERKTIMGDKRANTSKQIGFQKKKKFYTKKELEWIESSEAYGKYMNYLSN